MTNAEAIAYRIDRLCDELRSRGYDPTWTRTRDGVRLEIWCNAGQGKHWTTITENALCSYADAALADAIHRQVIGQIDLIC